METDFKHAHSEQLDQRVNKNKKKKKKIPCNF